MVGILIIAHGTLGESLIHCASHVLGSRPMQLMQIGVTIHDDPQQLLPQAIKLVKQLDQGDGVLVLTDVYGATPGNIACKTADSRASGRRGRRQPADAGARTDLSKGAAEGGRRQGHLGGVKVSCKCLRRVWEMQQLEVEIVNKLACTRARRPSSPSSPASTRPKSGCRAMAAESTPRASWA